MVRALLPFAVLLFATILFTGCRRHRIFLQLQDRENTIDRYAADHSYLKIDLAHCSDSPHWIIFGIGHMPHHIIAWYSLLKDSAGRVVRLNEYPQCESGNWLKFITYYFDADGKTFAHELRIDGFDPVDNEDDFGLLTQRTGEYYDTDFNSVSQYCTPTDRRRQQLITDSCTRFFGKDTVYSSLPDYLRANGFPDLSSLQ